MRHLILAAALLLSPGIAFAQGDSRAESERLKQLLEQKFGQQPTPTTRSMTPRNRDQPVDYFHVKPDGSVRPAPAPPPQGSPRSSTEGYFGLGPATVAEGEARPRSPADEHQQLAQSQQRSIGIARNTVVIQLKPDVTGDQIDRLLSKYGLRVVRHVPSLGLLHVEVPGGGQTRGLTTGQGSLTDVLEPPIVKSLREEPGVEAAFVDTTIGPRTLPRHSDVKAPVPGGQMSWHWRLGEDDDGNWGLKMLRMPPVWRVLERARAANPDRKPTRMTFLDVGFGTHSHLVYKAVRDGMPPNPPQATCQASHGTHVAGIAGALFNRGRGIDGMVPGAVVEAVPISADSWIEGSALGVNNAVDQRALLYTDALTELAEFLENDAPIEDDERRVVNVSLAYNWSAAGFEWGKDPARDQVLKTYVLNSAMSVRFLANRWKDRVLFVTAAGNDSYGLAEPLTAELATPFAFAGTYRSSTFKPVTNILVVEAIDRDGRRAPFSNVGGHVSAPGVDIMSTLAGVSDEFGVCSGTSQAAPHVTGLASILFELSPTSSPAQIADIIRTTAIARTGAGAAPRVDALSAVLKTEPKALAMLADLDGDGRVDEDDLLIFKKHMAVLEEARRTGGPIPIDLNGDNEVDDDERCWPLVDFNGSGRASLDTTDLAQIDGQPRSDLDIMQMTWSADGPKDFKTAYAELAFDELVEKWRGFGVALAPPAEAPKSTTANPLPVGTATAPITASDPNTQPGAGSATTPARRRPSCM